MDSLCLTFWAPCSGLSHLSYDALYKPTFTYLLTYKIVTYTVDVKYAIFH